MHFSTLFITIPLVYVLRMTPLLILAYIFSFQSKTKDDAHLLSPVKETKGGVVEPEEKPSGDHEKMEEKITEKEKREEEVGKENEEEEKNINQQGVTFTEGVEGSKKRGPEDDGNSSESIEKANQRLNEYTFSPSALHDALAHEGKQPNVEGSPVASDKK